MLLREGLTHTQIRIKPRFVFGESFTLNKTLWQENNSILGLFYLKDPAPAHHLSIFAEPDGKFRMSVAKTTTVFSCNSW